MRVVTFKVDDHLLERMQIAASLEGVSRSELIRRAVEEYVDRVLKKHDASPKVIRLRS